MVGDPLAQPHQGIAVFSCRNRTGRDQRRWMRHVRFDSATQLNPPSNRIDSHYFTSAGLTPRVMRLVANPNLVFLVRIEVVAENIRTLILVNLAAKLNGAD